MPNSKVLELKQESVKALSASIKEANVIFIVEYRGITADQVTKIRAEMRNAKADYKVLKNNISKRALLDNNIESLNDYLVGPVALILGKEDYLEPAKILYNFSKDNEFYKIKAGIIDGKFVSGEEIIALAKLPSRNELIAKLAGVLQANISKFAIAVEQVRLQKEQIA